MKSLLDSTYFGIPVCSSARLWAHYAALAPSVLWENSLIEIILRWIITKWRSLWFNSSKSVRCSSKSSYNGPWSPRVRQAICLKSCQIGRGLILSRSGNFSNLVQFHLESIYLLSHRVPCTCILYTFDCVADVSDMARRRDWVWYRLTSYSVDMHLYHFVSSLAKRVLDLLLKWLLHLTRYFKNSIYLLCLNALLFFNLPLSSASVSILLSSFCPYHCRFEVGKSCWCRLSKTETLLSLAGRYLFGKNWLCVTCIVLAKVWFYLLEPWTFGKWILLPRLWSI